MKRSAWIIVTLMMVLLVATSVVALTASERQRIKAISDRTGESPQEVMDRLGIDSGNSDSGSTDTDSSGSGDNSDGSDAGNDDDSNTDTGGISFDPPVVVDGTEGSGDTGSNDENTDNSGSDDTGDNGDADNTDTDDVGSTDNNDNTDNTDDSSDTTDETNGDVADDETKVDPLPSIDNEIDSDDTDSDEKDTDETDDREEDRNTETDIIRDILEPDRTSDDDIDDGVLRKEEITEYKRALRVAENHDIDIRVAKKLIHKKRVNKENYDAIVDIVQVTPTDEDSDREELVEELVVMTESFVSKVKEKLDDLDTKQDTQEQIEEYVEDIKHIKENPVPQKFEDDVVKAVFDKNKSFDDIFAEFG